MCNSGLLPDIVKSEFPHLIKSLKYHDLMMVSMLNMTIYDICEPNYAIGINPNNFGIVTDIFLLSYTIKSPNQYSP